jgi:hypothetical protein
MVHFPTLPSPSYEFRGRYSGINQSGFPHSEIPGSKPACGSPGLIAACHVLHRLLAPRHSPYALSSLTKCSLHLMYSRPAFLKRRGRKNHAVCGQKTTDCRVFSCQKSQKLLVASRGPPSRFALRRTTFAWLANRSNARCQALRRLVENIGIEPMTSWLQTRRSPS